MTRWFSDHRHGWNVEGAKALATCACACALVVVFAKPPRWPNTTRLIVAIMESATVELPLKLVYCDEKVVRLLDSSLVTIVADRH